MLIATFANNFGNIYMVFPFRVSVADVTTRKECFKPFFFLHHSNLSEVCHVSHWRKFSHSTFQLIFQCLLIFCVGFLVSDCQHGRGCDGAFVYCWMSCLHLKNIDQIILLQLLSFLCFIVCGIIRWPYNARISSDFPLIWRTITFYEGHRFSSFALFLYFCITYISLR